MRKKFRYEAEKDKRSLKIDKIGKKVEEQAKNKMNSFETTLRCVYVKC